MILITSNFLGIPLTKLDPDSLKLYSRIFGSLIPKPRGNARPILPDATPLIIALVNEATNKILSAIVQALSGRGTSPQKVNPTLLISAYNYVVSVTPTESVVPEKLCSFLFNMDLLKFFFFPMPVVPMQSIMLFLKRAKLLVTALLKHAPGLQAVAQDKTTKKTPVELKADGEISKLLDGCTKSSDLFELREYCSGKGSTTDGNRVKLIDAYNALLQGLKNSESSDAIIKYLDAIYKIGSGLFSDDKHKEIIAGIYGARTTKLSRFVAIDKKAKIGLLSAQFHINPHNFLRVSEKQGLLAWPVFRR